LYLHSALDGVPDSPEQRCRVTSMELGMKPQESTHTAGDDGPASCAAHDVGLALHALARGGRGAYLSACLYDVTNTKQVATQGHTYCPLPTLMSCHF
jgi:hypothetical protein